ncbi:hypothetical protein B194_1140 [Serratia plymuthica A30]|nr:hypothetical protein B194_1140 [Serratia plymuthica A30]
MYFSFSGKYLIYYLVIAFHTCLGQKSLHFGRIFIIAFAHAL